MIIRNVTLHITNWNLRTDGLFFWSARNGTPKANKSVCGDRIPDRTGVAKEDTAKNENTVRGGLKSSTYETDVKKIASASSVCLG